MQKSRSRQLKDKAISLLSDNSVSAVLGWENGELGYDVSPVLFFSAEEVEKHLVFNDFCAHNLSKALISKTDKVSGKILVFLKPCDTYSFNALLTEHKIERKKVFAVGVECNGMADIKKIKKICGEGIVSISEKEDCIEITTLYSDTPVTLERKDYLAERCMSCKSKKLVAYDDLIGNDGKVLDSNRFEEVEKLEALTPEERFEFWQNELSRCIRCNACRDICPACTCEKCVFDNPASGVENKAAANSFEEKMFHIIRAFHVAGRCTDCGECSRVCPQNIPLHLLNRKFIKDINTFYGEFTAGSEPGMRSPLTDYAEGDCEPADALERRDNNA